MVCLFPPGKLLQTHEHPLGDVIIYDSHLVLYRQTLDLMFYIVSTPNENELMLSAGFTAFYDAISLLFRNQIEKRVLLDNLDVLLLALDETFDDGYVHCPSPFTFTLTPGAVSSWRRIRRLLRPALVDQGPIIVTLSLTNRHS